MKLYFRITCMLVVIAALYGCHQDNFEPIGKQFRLVVNYNTGDLSNRVRVPQYEEMLSLYDIPMEATNGRLQKSNRFQNASSNYALVLRAEVDPPVYEKQTLRASHVSIEGTRAFVAYNTEGNDYLGGVDIFDITNIKKPVLKAQVIINGADFSAVAFHDDKIYLAGATGSAEEDGLESPAVVEIITWENNQVSDSSKMLDVMGFVATDVKIQGDKLYVTSGTNGGLSIYDLQTLELLDTKKLDDARSIAFSSDQFTVMQGMPARVNIYQTADGSLVQSYTAGGANVPESKSIVAMQNGLVFVPAGKEGLKVLDAATGENVMDMPLPDMPEEDPAHLVTNAVSVAGDKVFIANGAAGMYVARQQDKEIDMLGSVSFKASANYVESQGNVIFVATGTGGLKILEIVTYNPANGDYIPIGEWDGQGKPKYLCEEAGYIDQNLIRRFFTEFVSTKNVTTRHPDWFASGVVTDLILKENTDMTITFLHEGAGYKNTLGYYTYDSDHMPENAEALQTLTVLYPNVSYKGSGGNMQRGDKICLDDVKAGATLGFFLVANGWNGSKMTKGFYTHHTTPSFNFTHPEGLKQNSLLLYDEASDTIILTFEDIRRPGGDKDFEDAVFLIHLNNPKAIDKSRLIRLP